MCGLFGFSTYQEKVTHDLTKLTNSLALQSSVRGTDATGVAFCSDGHIQIHKEAAPAHKLTFTHPVGTRALIGHTRHSTQGSERRNRNNHPFSGRVSDAHFALAHNGVLINDDILRQQHRLPKSKIETDSYVAVQLIEKRKELNFTSLRFMAEELEGSYSFSILSDPNEVYLVKGDSPITLLRFPKEKIFVYTYINRAMTGTNDNRTDFRRMLKDAQKSAWDVVLVYKFDRFSRNKYEAAIHKKTLKDHGITLVSCKEHIPEGPEGVILESLLEGMAEYYSLELAQKVSRGQRESRIKGNYAGGGVPYGYRVENKKFVIHEDEAAIVVRIYEMYAAGTYGRNIIKALTDEGIMHRKGKPFTKTIIYGILQNTRYAGIYVHKTEGEYNNTFPRIVPQPLFESVQRIMEENRYGRHPKEHVVYLLKNKMRCGYCGKPVTADAGMSSNGEIMRYYKCGLKKQDTTLCRKKSIRKEILEQLIVDTTIAVLDDPETIDLITSSIFEAHTQKLKDTSVLNLLETERNKLRKALNNMLDAVAQGIITSSTKQRIEEIEVALEIAEGKVLAEKAKNQVQITPADIKRFIYKALKKEPYSMIRLLVKEIVLYDDKVEIYYNFIDKKGPGDLDHQAFCIYTQECDIDPKDFGFRYNAKRAKFVLKMYF